MRIGFKVLSAFTLFCAVSFLSLYAEASSGTEGASFLDIPVGAAPAALGSAYTARATDAYAPVWNPAGLGFANGVRFSGMHLAYLQGLHYEYLGAAVPFHKGQGVGASVQYLGSNNILGADENGAITGSFSASFAAYSLSYGQALTDQWSAGLTGKVITESIADASAHAFAVDAGAMYKYSDRLTFGAVLANMGSHITFVNDGDPLPLAFRGGALLQLLPTVDASAEFVCRKTGLVSGSGGIQWRYNPALTFRAGLDSSHTRGLSALSAFRFGVGFRAFGQDFAYAWVPYSDLGNAHYFSLDFRFGGALDAEKPGVFKVDTP